MRTILAPRACAILYDLLMEAVKPRRFLLPANICPIVAITFFKAGVPIEFVDISSKTLGMDLNMARARLAQHPESYGGLLYSHTYGDASSPADVFRELKEHFPQLLVIDDRCLCLPDLDPPASSAADVILYSTGYAKIVDLGYGGYAFLHDDVAFGHRHLAFRKADLDAIEAGYKACIEAGSPYTYEDSGWLQTEAELPAWDEYRVQVNQALQASLEHRRAINAVYNSRVPSELQLPSGFQLWRFSLRVSRKRQVLEAIFSAGLFASSHYASLDGIMGEGGGKNARQLAHEVINLFNDHHYTLEMAERTAQIVLGSL